MANSEEAPLENSRRSQLLWLWVGMGSYLESSTGSGSGWARLEQFRRRIGIRNPGLDTHVSMVIQKNARLREWEHPTTVELELEALNELVGDHVMELLR